MENENQPESYGAKYNYLNYPTLKEMEQEEITGRLKKLRGNLTAASKSLGLGRATLYRKIKEYEIDLDKIRRGI